MSGLVRTRCVYSPARRRAEPSHQRGDLHDDDNVSAAPGWRTSGRMTVCSGQGEVSGSQSGSLCVNTGGGGSGSNSFRSGAKEEDEDVSGPLSPSGTPQRACQASSGVRAAAGGQVLARDGPEPGCLARPAASSSSVVDLVSSSDSSGVQIVDAEGGDESGTQSADAPLQEGVDCLLTRDTGVVSLQSPTRPSQLAIASLLALHQRAASASAPFAGGYGPERRPRRADIRK